MKSREDEAMEVDEVKDKEEEVKVDVKVKGVKIAENLICQITAENVGRNKKLKTGNRIPVLILDCSGSMGRWVQESVNAFIKLEKERMDFNVF